MRVAFCARWTINRDIASAWKATRRAMVRKSMTLREIHREGVQALLDRLGPAGTIRFLQQYDMGRGDYTKERDRWLDGVTIDEVVEDIERRRAQP